MADQSIKASLANGPPIEEIERAAATYLEVKLIMRRRDRLSGKLATLPTLIVPTIELADGSLDERVRQLYGGGSFTLDVRDPRSPMTRVVQPYAFEIEGPPITPQQQRANVASMAGNGMPAAGGPVYFPGVAGAAAFDHAPTMASVGLDPSQFMGQTPDQIAMHFNTRLEADRAEMKKELAELRKETERELKAARDLAAKRESELAEERAKHERQMLQQQIEALRTSINAEPRQRGLDFGQLAGLVTAIVPVLTSLISSRASHADTTLKLQQENARAQLDGIKELVRSQAERAGGVDKLFEAVIKIAPLVVPVAKVWIEERSPSKQAEVFSTLAENNLTTLNMVAQFMNQFAEQQPEAWWGPLVKQAIGGIQEMAQQMAAQRRPPQQQQLQPNGAGDPAAVARAIADEIVAAPGVPKEFKTAEWRRLFELVHNPQVAPQAAAVEIGNHLDRLNGTAAMPEHFRDFHNEKTGKEPRVYLHELLIHLPIAQDRVRMEAICDAFAEAYADDDGETEVEAESEVVDEPKAEEEEVQAEVVG